MNEPLDAPQSASIGIAFVRSNFSRVIHVDGAWGTYTPQWDIHLALYSERWSLPEQTTIVIAPDGSMSEEPVRGSGVTREIEADVILTESAAVRLRDFLDERLKQLRQARYGAQQPE